MSFSRFHSRGHDLDTLTNLIRIPFRSRFLVIFTVQGGQGSFAFLLNLLKGSFSRKNLSSLWPGGNQARSQVRLSCSSQVVAEAICAFVAVALSLVVTGLPTTTERQNKRHTPQHSFV